MSHDISHAISGCSELLSLEAGRHPLGVATRGDGGGGDAALVVAALDAEVALLACEKRRSFLDFSYVCPEPVLVK